MTRSLSIKADRIQHWLNLGAQLTENVRASCSQKSLRILFRAHDAKEAARIRAKASDKAKSA